MACYGNSTFAQTYSKKSDKNFNLSQFMERKTSVRSPKKSALAERQPNKQPKVQKDMVANAGMKDKNSSKPRSGSKTRPRKQQFNLNLDQVRNEFAPEGRIPQNENAGRFDKQRLTNLGEERQKSKERKQRLAHSRSSSPDHRPDAGNFENVPPTGVPADSQAGAKSPVKIAVKDLMLDSTPKALQERLYSHEVQPGGRVLAHCPSNAEVAAHGHSQSLRKRRRTAAERAEQRSMKSSIINTDGN